MVLPDLAGGSVATRLRSPVSEGSLSVVREALLQVESFVNACARAHASFSAFKTLGNDLDRVLALSAGSLVDWLRIASEQNGAKAEGERSWGPAVRGAEELRSHLAALQAETRDVTSWLAMVAAAHTELEAETRLWLHSLPKESFSQRAADVLLEPSSLHTSPSEGVGLQPFLAEIVKKHPHTTLKVITPESDGLPLLGQNQPRDTMMHTQGFGATKRSESDTALNRNFGGNMRGGLSGNEKMTWACTAARLSKASKRGGALQKSFGLTTTAGFHQQHHSDRRPGIHVETQPAGNKANCTLTGQGLESEATMRMQIEDLTAELEVARSSVLESKMEMQILRGRLRDKAPPVVLRIGGQTLAQKEAIKHGDVGGTLDDDISLTCTKLAVPDLYASTVQKISDQDALEVQRLRYQLSEMEKDLARAHRFLGRHREELAEEKKETDRLHLDIAKLRKQLQDEITKGNNLSAMDTKDLLRELRSRTLESGALGISGGILPMVTNRGPTKRPSVSGANPSGQAELDESVKASRSVASPSREGSKGVAELAPVSPLPLGSASLTPHRRDKDDVLPSRTPARRCSKVDFFTKPEQPEPLKKRENLWQLARAFVQRLSQHIASIKDGTRRGKFSGLASIRAKGTSQALVELGLSDLYNTFSSEFDSGDMGIFEFVGRHSRDQEFNLQVQELVGSKYLIRSFSQESATADLKALESRMAGVYNDAYQKAGGDRRAKMYWADANRWLERLANKREGKFRAGYVVLGTLCQDAGYQLMGMDALYDTCRMMEDKFVGELKRIALKTQGTPDCAPLKGRPRARSKVLTKYGNNASLLTDVVRGSICYPGIKELYEGLMYILEQEIERGRNDFYVLEINDRFQHPKDGYRDISMLVNVDGVAGELQLHIRQIKDAKKGDGHDAYKTQRAINESLFEACVRGNVADVLTLAGEYKCCAASVSDKHGRTALHYGCQVGSIQAVRALILYRANPWCADSRGVLPFEVALRAACRGGMKTQTTAKACKHCDAAVIRPYNYCGGAACSRPQWRRQQPIETGHADVVKFVLAAMRSSDSKDVGQGPARLVNNVIPWWVDHVVHMNRGESRESWLHVGRAMVDMVVSLSKQKSAMSEYRDKLREGGWVLGLNDWVLDAAAKGQHERVSVLLEVGFDEAPGYGKPWLLDKAIENGHTKLVTILMRSQLPNARKVNQCTINRHLKYAAKLENPTYADAALMAKADPDAWDARREKSQRTPLMTFAAAGNLEMCKKIVECRAQVDWTDKFGCVALHYARALNHTDVAEYLQDVKHVVELRFRDDNKFEGYLFQAIERGATGAIWRFLKNYRKEEGTLCRLSSGGNLLGISEGDEDFSPVSPANLLHMRNSADKLCKDDPSAIVGNKDVEESEENFISRLLSTKAGTNEYTALHVAVWHCTGKNPHSGEDVFYRSDFQVCRALIRNRADPMSQTIDGLTPLHFAAQKGIPELYNLLIEEFSRVITAEQLEILQTKILNRDQEAPLTVFHRCQLLGKMRRLAQDEEREDPTLIRIGFTAFVMNKTLSHLNGRLDRVRESSAQTLFEILRAQKNIGLPTREEVVRQVTLAKAISGDFPDASMETAFYSTEPFRAGSDGPHTGRQSSEQKRALLQRGGTATFKVQMMAQPRKVPLHSMKQVARAN